MANPERASTPSPVDPLRSALARQRQAADAAREQSERIAQERQAEVEREEQNSGDD